MDACYYCGGPLQPGTGTCRFCGTPVDPLDVPLCDSENSTILDEAPVQQLTDVEYPPLLSFDDLQDESGMENETVASFEDQADSAAQETAPEEPVSVPQEPQIVPEEPDTVPEEPADIVETVISPENGAEQPAPVLSDNPESDVEDPEPQEDTENESEKKPLFSINTLPGQDQTCVIVKYLGGSADSLQIPDEIDGLQVKGIGRSAFAHCAVREIVLPDSLQSIGDYAFTGCISLQSITGGNGVMEIGHGVFNGCLHLERCDFLKNHGLHRPFDAFVDRIISQLGAVAKTDNGEL